MSIAILLSVYMYVFKHLTYMYFCSFSKSLIAFPRLPSLNPYSIMPSGQAKSSGGGGMAAVVASMVAASRESRTAGK